MDTTIRRRTRATTFRAMGWLTVASMVGLALAGPSAGIASAKADKVTLCHASGQAGTTKFETLTVGYSAAYANANGNGGHFTASGTAQAGHELDYLGACTSTESTQSTTTSASTTSTSSTGGETSTQSTQSTQSTTTPPDNTTTDSTTPAGGVGGATAMPQITPPPTSTLPTSGTPSGDTWRIALLAIAGLLATLLLLAPATPATARRRR